MFRKNGLRYDWIGDLGIACYLVPDGQTAFGNTLFEISMEGSGRRGVICQDGSLWEGPDAPPQRGLWSLPTAKKKATARMKNLTWLHSAGLIAPEAFKFLKRREHTMEHLKQLLSDLVSSRSGLTIAIQKLEDELRNKKQNLISVDGKIDVLEDALIIVEKNES